MEINFRSFVLILFLTLSGLISAQKIKVKKGTIYIDNVEISINVESEYKATKNMGDFHQILTFSKKEELEPFLIVDYKGKMITPNGPKETWFEISRPNELKTKSIDIDRKYGEGKKGLISHLINKYHFFNKKGVVETKNIEEFFNSETISQSKIKAEKGQAKEEDIANRISTIKPFVKNDLKTIVKGGAMGTEVIGTILAPDKYHQTDTTPIEIIDLDNNVIASASTNILAQVNVDLIDGSSFSYKGKYQLNGGLGNHNFLTELVEQVIGKGFELGNSYLKLQDDLEKVDDEERRKNKEQKEIIFRERLAKSNHIFEKNGYVITKEGEKIQGLITIFFENVNHPDNNAYSFINGLPYSDGDGTLLSIKFKDEKGEYRLEKVKAKENVSFAILEENGGKKIYKALTLGNILFKEWRFHPFIETYNKVDIYESYEENFIIKKSDKQNSYYIDYKLLLNADEYTRKEKIKFVKFLDYLCEIEDLPLNEEDIDIEGLGLSDYVKLIDSQYSSNNIESVKNIIDATKDCIIKK